MRDIFLHTTCSWEYPSTLSGYSPPPSSPLRKMKSSRSILVGFLLVAFTCSLGSLGADCLWDMDCPGYKADAFCSSERCMEGVCRLSPSPCLDMCSEQLRACVECESAADCPQPTLSVCDSYSHVCRACREHRDCDSGTWCTGGHWLCAGDRCLPPPQKRWPCKGQVESCVEELHQCTRCYKDDDCGGGGRPYDFCTNRVRCNTTTLTCQNEAPLSPAECRFCDSNRQTCAECLEDTDCITQQWRLSIPFCSAPVERPACRSGACVLVPNIKEGESSLMFTPEPPCHGDTACCDESRKVCVLCPATQATAVTSSIPPSKPVVAIKTQPPSPAAVSCSVHSDCDALGWLCRPASRTDPSVRECKPCRTDAQCIQGSIVGVCNKLSGRCSIPLLDQRESISLTLSAETTGSAGNKISESDHITTSSEGTDSAVVHVETVLVTVPWILVFVVVATIVIIIIFLWCTIATVKASTRRFCCGSNRSSRKREVLPTLHETEVNDGNQVRLDEESHTEDTASIPPSPPTVALPSTSSRRAFDRDIFKGF